MRDIPWEYTPEGEATVEVHEAFRRIIDRLNQCVANREQRVRGTTKLGVRRAILTAEIEALRVALDIVAEEGAMSE